MKTLKIGLVGCGGIQTWAHTPYYKRDSRAVITACCDIVRDRACKIRDTLNPEAEVYTDYKEMLEKADIDAVDICTPNYLHSEIAVAAFQVGKHVFCEKPDAIDADKAEQMRDAANAAGKVLMVMRNNRFTDAAKYLRTFIEEGKAGEIYCGRCGWQRRRGIPGRGGWFTTKAKSGGGPLIDLGVHMIDLAVWLMGNPTPVSVSGMTYNKFANDTADGDSDNCKFGDSVQGGTFDVEDLAMGFIRFDNGAVLQIEFSWASNIKVENRFVELRGTKAGFTIRNSQMEIYTEDHGNLLDIVPPGNQADDGHARNLKNFLDVVLEGAEPCFKPQQGVDMIKILQAFYKSAETGKEVRL